MRRLILACVPVVLLSACASMAPRPATARLDPPAPSAADTPYGMFLAGNAALTEGRNGDAAKFLDLARAESGDDPAVAERAFTAALLAGDIDRAALIAPQGEGVSDSTKRMGRLVRVVAALADGKGKVAREALGTDGIGFPHRGVAALLAPWVAAASGDAEGAAVQPSLRGDGGVDYFGRIGQAALFERARRFDEAETDLKALAGSPNASDIAVLAYGGFLERRARRPEAVALYDTALGRNPGNLALRAARTRAAGGKTPPPMVTLKEGAAFALLGPAATAISARQEQIGLAYLRMALRLDPNRTDAWLLLGDLLQSNGDVDGARAAYGKARPSAPEFPAAQAKLAWSYQGAGDKETALKLARSAAAGGDSDARLTLSDLLRANEKYDEALSLLNTLIAESRGAPPWTLYYARAVAYEKTGDWPKAEADLRQALSLRPDEPELLNYLGYAWIDRGEHLQDALGMVQKAVAGNPRSGAIVDSLGWAYYRLGDYAKAVELLEQAVELEAGDPEINDHLGDAYWMVGRKDEAGFQWRRVLTLRPDDKIKASAEGKLANGLGPVRKVAGS